MPIMRISSIPKGLKKSETRIISTREAWQFLLSGRDISETHEADCIHIEFTDSEDRNCVIILNAYMANIIWQLQDERNRNAEDMDNLQEENARLENLLGPEYETYGQEGDF